MDGYKQEKIWDPITRIWHWILVFCVSCSWIFGEFMSFSNVIWHFYLGYFIGSLILFRIVWGLIGPIPIRLSRLLASLGEIPRYAKGLFSKSPSGTPGHNPLGSASIIAILLLLFVQVASGLFIETDDFFESGPLIGYVSEDLSDRLTYIHHICAKLILAVVFLHVSAILFYLFWKKENLIKPMFTGMKWVKRQSK